MSRFEYFVEEFTADERKTLSGFFTNVDGPVFALVNLPEVVKGALFARYSRSPKSLRRLFLDEFVSNPDLGIETIAEQPGVGDGVDVDRAVALYEKVFTDFGDDSVAQLGGVHLACEQSSNILTKMIEWGRMAAYLEQSTRYIYYDKPLGGRYRYFVPAEIRDSKWNERYVEVIDNLFNTYKDLAPSLREHYEAKFPRVEGTPAVAYNGTIRAKVCDDLRGLLPAATTSNVGIYANGQAYESMILRMRAHPLQEVRDYSQLMLDELRKVIPAFMRRVDLENRGIAWTRYFADIDERMRAVAHEHQAQANARPAVTLVDWDVDAELKIAAAALYAYSLLPDDQLLEIVRAMGVDERRKIVEAYVGDRKNRRHKPGRAFERASYRFDIISDYGAFRDLQRHRMLTIEWQTLSFDLGHITPDTLIELNLDGKYDRAIAAVRELYGDLASDLGKEVAQYVVPFAANVRYMMQLNAREAFHLLELRTAAAGHSSYRRICQQMHRLIGEKAGHGLIAGAMKFVDHEDYQLGRLDGEKRSAAKRAEQES
ncbi:MAG: thymidylate synthase [Deltaproteobacteria bacterium RIFOXYA12_FULL_58_15]|nr:MAG: thymidylate synthase [Deltaproteobacteria bacterium RIFOXYA12_FULL_58_15]OGR14134.1 MAG: thymidylate synthase [Deltaproteobacteria bacterium RIFOXYB12_FULL_58_9]